MSWGSLLGGSFLFLLGAAGGYFARSIHATSKPIVYIFDDNEVHEFARFRVRGRHPNRTRRTLSRQHVGNRLLPRRDAVLDGLGRRSEH